MMTTNTIRPLLAGTLATLALVALATPASAWTRNGSVTTQRGTYVTSGSGYCAYGVCQRSGSVTGPYGGTVSRSGAAVRTAPGVVTYGGTMTGPRGGTIMRSGTISRY
ncbi:hypothetical protein OSH11_08255 [Kaistia dalseonensis]|uniref:Uncharacterized protein n=1 Tax=Kaistia dalseonensis TaxID=410840 RepID=A0ABU0H4P1_9HYPH|nr:hypothetical protein [Kaistia dalseonensis]MCX5494692.1 hypothetical protein [Kaistia dalseonensis]MDQ0437273.1 hypothetical protein [Kaistia dalseonensis]